MALEVYGVSNCLRREVESGRLSPVVEWSNAGIAWRFKAAAMGVPFLPVRSMLGTDTFKYSSAKVVRDPFTGATVCLLPALILDVGLIHVHRADIHGNAQVDGITGFCVEMARASKRLIISTERIVPTDEIRAPSGSDDHPLLSGRRRRRGAVRVAPRRDGLRLRTRRGSDPRVGRGEQDTRDAPAPIWTSTSTASRTTPRTGSGLARRG